MAPSTTFTLTTIFNKNLNVEHCAYGDELNILMITIDPDTELNLLGFKIRPEINSHSASVSFSTIWVTNNHA